MTIACNSAYFQTEALNFTLAWQAIIVRCQTLNINVLADYFLPVMLDYALTASKQSVRLLTYMLHI